MHCRDYEPLSEETLRQFTRALSEGILYIHKRGIIHRDIKPENLLLSDITAVERPVLADFGLARHLPAETTIIGRCGTKGYMSPEILAGDPYALPADIWAFGTLIYALATSQLPFPVLEGTLTKDNIEQFHELMMESNLSFELPSGIQISTEL